MQEGDCQAAKSYTDKNKGVFLFVSFATLSYPPSHPSSGMIFFSFFLKLLAQIPMQILLLDID